MAEPAIAVVGLPGKWSTERLAEVVAERTGACPTIDLARVHLDLGRDTCTCDGLDLTRLDALLVKKIDLAYSPQNLDRIEILRWLEARGVAVFSRPDRIARLINRLSCTVELRAAGFPVPETVVTEDVEHAARAVLEFGGAVLKPLYSTKARGMRVVEGGDLDRALRELTEFRDAGNRTLYVQRLIHVPERDLGVVFVGDEYLTTYARVKTNDSWNTTTRSGGSYDSETIDDATLELARRVRDHFGLDFTVVDVVLTDEGPFVFEVSAFGGFRGILEGCGIDAAQRFADHALAELQRRKGGAAR